MKAFTLEEAQPSIDAGCPTEWHDGGFYVKVDNEWIFVMTPGSRLPEPKPTQDARPVFDTRKLFTIALLCALLGGGVGSLGTALMAKNILMNEKGIEGPQGPAGENGVDGANGKNGTDGLNGKDGIVTSLSSIPGWPTNCTTPTVTTITVPATPNSISYPVILCGPTSTAAPTPTPTQ